MKKNTSFTLIELLVVIVIIGVLAAVIVVTTTSSISKANIAKLKVFEESVANNLAANMVSRWKLDGDANDAWGSNNGTWYGASSGTITSEAQAYKLESECISGQCMQFDGIDDYIDYGNDESLNIKDEITISAWIKSVDTSAVILIKENGGNWTDLKYSLWSRGGTFQACIGGSSWLNSLIKPSGEWQHVLWSFNKNISNNNWKIYINGELKKSLQYTSSIDIGGNVYLGTWYHDFDYAPFNGLIDDVRIYNAALSSSQIKQDYIAGLNSLLGKGLISKDEYNSRIESLSQN